MFQMSSSSVTLVPLTCKPVGNTCTEMNTWCPHKHFKIPARFCLKRGSFPAFFHQKTYSFSHQILASLHHQKSFKCYYVPAARNWWEAQAGVNCDHFLKMLFHQKILCLVNKYYYKPKHPLLITALWSTY